MFGDGGSQPFEQVSPQLHGKLVRLAQGYEEARKLAVLGDENKLVATD
jgi:hypothetical protein